MDIIFFVIVEFTYYLFMYYLLDFYEYFALLNSAWILLIISLLLTLPSFILKRFISNKNKYFIISSIFIIITSTIFFFFGNKILNIFNLSTGLINFTMYIYKILFMFFPFTSLFFYNIHNLFYKQQKKQLLFIIALKRIIPIFIFFIIMQFVNFTNALYILSAIDFIFNICSFRKNEPH